jgi:hypothetical protein
MNDATNPKVAAEKARDTYRKTARRKTTRKVGTGKAHRTDRKTASKVVAEEARGPYRKTAHPKTTRKVGTGKAHGSDRKTASKVAAEKARGTYRKTAARFEEFAYDAQMPESMRALAEKSVAQTRELYVHSLEAVLESWERFVVAAGQGTVVLNRKAIDIALRNINNGFGLAERLAGAKNLAEAMELQTSYWRKHVGELASQAGEMRTLSTKLTADVAAPIKAQVTRRMKGLHKAT